MGRRGSGVEIRERSIRLNFTLDGGRARKETLKVNGKPIPPTIANLKYASRVAAQIKAAIDAGVFDYAKFFPESKHAKEAGPHRFFDVADLWMKAQGQLEDATRDQYAGAVRLWKQVLGDAPISELTHQRLAATVGSYPWASPKRANNALIVLRGIFGFEYNGARAANNPMIGIRNLKVVKRLPDPLTGKERDDILADLKRRYDVRVWAYFAFAFYSGMRPEEIIALRWPDIDLVGGIARVQRVRTFRGSERDGSKTHAERDVDLVPPARAALTAMGPFTAMKDAEIFENPVTRRPWHDERSQRDHYWNPTLRRLGIRRRRAYVTRHTYATVALMGGVKPGYIAAQLGHSQQMFFERYARWINGADQGIERKALERAMNS